MRKQLIELLKNLSEEDIKALYTPTSEEETTFSVPIIFPIISLASTK